MKIHNIYEKTRKKMTFTYGVCKNAGFFENFFLAIFACEKFGTRSCAKKLANFFSFFRHFFLHLTILQSHVKNLPSIFEKNLREIRHKILVPKNSHKKHKKKMCKKNAVLERIRKLFLEKFLQNVGDVKMQVFLRNFFYILRNLTFFFSKIKNICTLL